MEHVCQTMKIRETRSSSKTVCVRLDNIHVLVDIHIDPDSGGDVNVMDEHQLKALINCPQTYPPTIQDQVKHLATLPPSERGILHNYLQPDLWETSDVHHCGRKNQLTSFAQPYYHHRIGDDCNTTWWLLNPNEWNENKGGNHIMPN